MRSLGVARLAKVVGAGVILLCAAAPSLAANSQKSQVITVEYQALNAGTGAGPAGPIIAEARFEPKRARFLMLEIEDGSGGAVLAKVFQDQEVTTICSTTPEPVLIRPDYPVTVRMYSGRCYDGTPSVVTSGVVSAELFDKLPTPLPRTESRPFSATAPEVTGKDGEAAYLTAVTFTVGPKERRLDLTIEDSTGTPVFTKVEQGRGGFPSDSGVEVCGATDRPIPVVPGSSLTVFIYAGSCDGGTGSPTNGVVRATFSKP